MADNKERIERIIKRAIDYNNGWITADAFSVLEEMDGENEEALHISFIKRNKIIRAINEILDQDDEDFFKPEPEPQEPAFSMTLDEYNALSLYDKSQVYNEHPDYVKKLLSEEKNEPYTQESFRALPLHIQSKYYYKSPEIVKALLEGRLSSIEREVFEE